VEDLDRGRAAPGQPFGKFMTKFELTKTIEAVKLNKRTMRVLGPQTYTIPYGSMITDVTPDRDNRRFFYLGEPYECSGMVIDSALKEIK
jgi:hypothetical protein